MTASQTFRRICLAQIANGNSSWVTTLNTKALAMIAAGNGHLSPLTSGSQNGKSYTRNLILTALDVADITQSAIDEAAGVVSAGDDGCPTFTHLDHGNQFVNS